MATASYRYDAMGRQVTRTWVASGVTIHSVFDSQGRRIAEYNEGTGAISREYVWMGWDPVAVIEGGVIYLIRADHIGRPSFATTLAGTKVWSAVYLPFGGVHVTTGAPIDARFPGQWFQTEAGLYQNWMRDYDPTTGRYIEADPLGLVDGASVYGYAGGNPGRYTDPTGEFIPAIIGGALIGAALDFGLQYWSNDGRLECINFWQVGMSGILGAASGGFGGAAGKQGLVGGLRGLSNSTKGKIGEALTRASTPRLWLAGKQSRQVVIGNGLSSRADFMFRRGGFIYYVESKFGKSTLTRAQRIAQRALGGRYIVDRWGYDYFGRAGGYLGGAFGLGASFPFFPTLPNEPDAGSCDPCGD